MDPFAVAGLYVLAGLVFVPLGFKFFGTRYQFIDVLLASLAAGAASLIPTIGGVASYAAMVLVLYWRLQENLFPDIVVATGAARLALIPLMMALR
jgi:hypothetical protein